MCPQVSVGLPVYNADQTLSRVLEALLSQSFYDIELIISDNHSTDNTPQICNAFAQRDSRIKYFRQERNEGAINNFKHVLDRSTAPYFMWAAADDFWLPTFIQENWEVLEKRSDIVASISRVKMSSIAHKSSILVNTYPLLERHYIFRLRSFLRSLRANSRFYSLYRTNVLKKAFVAEKFMGGMDVTTIVKVLEYGGFYEINKTLMERSCYGTSSKLLTEQFAQYNIKGIEKIFPFWGFTVWLWTTIGCKHFFYSIDAILKVNLFFSLVVISEWMSIRKPKVIK